MKKRRPKSQAHAAEHPGPLHRVLDQSEQVQEKAEDATVDQSLAIEGISVSIGASVGIATFPADGTPAKALLKHADLSMYAAKTQLTP